MTAFDYTTNAIGTSDWLVATAHLTIKAYTEIESVEPRHSDRVEKVRFSQPPLTRTVDEATHQSLLDQSLRDYKDIWEDLAKR